MADPRIIDVQLDETSLGWRSPDVEQERRIAIFDLIEGNHFAPQRVYADGYAGPYKIKLQSEEGRLGIHIHREDDTHLETLVLALGSLIGTGTQEAFQLLENAGGIMYAMAYVALFSIPLPLPLDLARGLASPYIQGTLICFALNAALLAVFIKRITRNLRARDARLADLRQRAAEEEHIVRMGLLASGAAHELGTPLATLSVILGDWQHLPHFSSDPELLAEVSEMQVQIERCKSIVSGILLSAGEARGDSSAKTTVSEFLQELVDEWRATRPVSAFTYENRFGDDVLMVDDSAIEQMICNVLDNALEASPRWLRLDAAREGDALTLTVTDAGPGFAPGMLSQFGKPYQSTKGRPGAGLGLFLVVNVARTIGGTVEAANRPGLCRRRRRSTCRPTWRPTGRPRMP
jgi:two-component system sensor histidine kinase RegB